MKPLTEAIFKTSVAAVLWLTANPACAQYSQINLIGDIPGTAAGTDSNLKDPWGLAFSHNGPAVVANRATGTATLYSAGGQQIPQTVNIPAAPNQAPGTPGSPTGVVFNSSSDFVISKNGRSAPARLIFDTLDGLICAWSPEVDPSNALVIVDNSSIAPFPASYTALALSRNSSGQNVLYLADSGSGPSTSNNQITMYDGKFNRIGQFGDPGAPAGMTVFGVQNIGASLYVTYAAFVPINGGVVDVFDTDGNLQKTFAQNSPAGPLEEPWAVVVAPNDFGKFGGALLVGNFGDGRINAYDPSSGNFLGQLEDANGIPISSGLGLWTLAFREGLPLRGSHRGMYFTSGINNEADGLFGLIVSSGR
jgi:uncharacterized protein (TIGR03118 family)